MSSVCTQVVVYEGGSALAGLLQEEETMQLGCGVLLQLHRESEHCLSHRQAVEERG